MPQCIDICKVVLTVNTDFSVRNIDGPFYHKFFSPYVISGFRLEVAENCALLGNYAAINGNCLALLAAK